MLLESLGGSGEKGRVGFLLEIGEKKIVLDYGIKRKIHGSWDEIYPERVDGRVDLLYVSHAHQDHSGAIPLLEFEKLLCSEPTLFLLKNYVSSWMKTAKMYDAPLNERKYEEFLNRGIRIVKEKIDWISIDTGKSGHTVGSTWIRLEHGISLLYTGDITLDSPLYAFDDLKRADVLIVDTAYGSRKIEPRESLMGLILRFKHRRVVLPLPRVGRSQEILLTMLRSGMMPVYVDERILRAFDVLERFRDWLKMDINTPEVNTELPTDLPAGVYLTTDGMVTRGSSLKLYKLLKGDPNTIFILTGHQEEGTYGWKLLRDGENAIEFVWKVHPDLEDVLRIIETVSPSYTIVFHADEGESKKMVEMLNDMGVRSGILKRGESLRLEEIA